MATKQLYATGTFKYQNRMMKAGDPVEMDAPTARLYTALDKVTDKAPRRAVKPANLNEKTKAELARMAGLAPAEAKKLTKAQIIAKL